MIDNTREPQALKRKRKGPCRGGGKRLLEKNKFMGGGPHGKNERQIEGGDLGLDSFQSQITRGKKGNGVETPKNYSREREDTGSEANHHADHGRTE